MYSREININPLACLFLTYLQGTITCRTTLHHKLVNFAFAYCFLRTSYCERATVTPHRPTNSDRNTVSEIFAARQGRFVAKSTRHAPDFTSRGGRAVHGDTRHGHDQSPACGGPKRLRVERDGPRRPHQRQYRWIAYVKSGSITEPSGAVLVSQKWLESAFSREQEAFWKDRLHEQQARLWRLQSVTRTMT